MSHAVAQGPLCLHLGCGERRLPGYLHVDLRPLEGVDRVGPADDLSWAADASADEVYACQLLEHFGRWEVPRVLAEWRRVLRPGGVLRLSVPDFKAMAKVYGRTGDLGLILGLLHGRQDYPANTHIVSFDEASLRRCLDEAGFEEVRRWDPHSVFPPGYDDLSMMYIPHMDRERGTLMSLNLEARRGRGVA